MAIPSDALASGVSPYYRSRARSLDPTLDPLAAQFIPQAAETLTLPYETDDPIGDQRHLVSPRLVHHYRDRVLMLVTDRCATYCRHCFRRHFVGNHGGVISPQELEAAAQYIADHPEVQEILLSGGDPLILGADSLLALIDRLRQARPNLIVRVSTRLPLMAPERLTQALAVGLGDRQPLWIVLHVNHAQEIGPEVVAALDRMARSGLPMVSQTVLLRGVNDSVAALEELFRTLLRQRVKPYYLFQGDLAAGTSHFRVSLDRGLQIYAELRTRLSGLGLPTYAIDLPNGAGKVPIASPYYLGRFGDWHRFQNLEGAVFNYPAEDEAQATIIPPQNQAR